jgi:hypothetical protein
MKRQPYHDEIEELLEKIDELPEGPGQVATAEEAVRIADTHRDPDAGFVARKALTKAAIFAGRPDLATVSFSWCLSKTDEDSDRYDETELLWQYKWVIENTPDFPTISRQQMKELFADMTARYRRAGSTLHAVYQIARDVAVAMHDPDTALDAQRRMENVRRDHLSNCKACVQDSEIEYHSYFGRDEDALEAARVILDGRMSCAEVPHRTYAIVLLPLVRVGKLERASRYYKTGYKMVRQNPKFVRHKSYHLQFLTLTGNLDRAAKLFERHLPEAVESVSPNWRFEFYLAARLFLEAIPRGVAMPMFTLPDAVRLPAGPQFPALVSWLDGELRQIAATFDARNENDGYARRVAGFRELLKHAEPYRLDGKD